MMHRFLISILALLFCSFLSAQTALELYNDRNYPELVKLEKTADKLTPDELYMVGFAFFQLENDTKAITFYDDAIKKGLDNGQVHFYKGLSLRYLKKYEEAMAEIDIAIIKEPTNQEFFNEKGLIYYYQRQQDEALKVFEQAKTLPKTYPEPYYWVAHIYHEKQEYNKALALYYEALEILPKENSYYLDILTSIGQIEYVLTKDYPKSALAYVKAINLAPKNYALYPKLIKAYNGGKEFAKADSVFGLLKTAFNNNELSEGEMKFKSTAIDEYQWNGQGITVYKYFIDPKESLDISYKVYLLNMDGKNVERTFMVEQTIQLPGGPKHLLCEKNKKTNAHITYLYGWDSDVIPLDDLKKAVGLVLDGKMKPGASSNTRNK